MVVLVSKHRLNIKIRKCEFAKLEVELICHIADKNEVQLDPKKMLGSIPCYVPSYIWSFKDFRVWKCTSIGALGLLRRSTSYYTQLRSIMLNLCGQMEGKKHLGS